MWMHEKGRFEVETMSPKSSEIRSPQRINFMQRHQIFVVPECVNSLEVKILNPRILRYLAGFMKNFCTPCLDIFYKRGFHAFFSSVQLTSLRGQLFEQVFSL